MKYRFTLPAKVGDAERGGQMIYDVVFDCETPAENDLGDAGEAAQMFVDRAVACARYVVRALEKKQ